MEDFLFLRSGRQRRCSGGKGGWGKKGQTLFRGGPFHVMQDVGGSGGQRGSVPDEGVAAVGGMPVNRAGNAEDLPSLFPCRPRRDQGSAASGGFHHQRRAAPAAHDAVAHGKGGAGGGQLHREFGDYRSMAVRNALRQVSVFPWIQLAEARSDDGDGASPRIQGSRMGLRIHAARQSGNDGYPGLRQVMRDGSGA